MEGWTFHPEVLLVFSIDDPDEPDRIPLLLSPFGHSTDRGSRSGTRFLSGGGVRPTMCKGCVKNVLRLDEQPSIVRDRVSPVDGSISG